MLSIIPRPNLRLSIKIIQRCECLTFWFMYLFYSLFFFLFENFGEQHFLSSILPDMMVDLFSDKDKFIFGNNNLQFYNSCRGQICLSQTLSGPVLFQDQSLVQLPLTLFEPKQFLYLIFVPFLLEMVFTLQTCHQNYCVQTCHQKQPLHSVGRLWARTSRGLVFQVEFEQTKTVGKRRGPFLVIQAHVRLGPHKVQNRLCA